MNVEWGDKELSLFAGQWKNSEARSAVCQSSPAELTPAAHNSDLLTNVSYVSCFCISLPPLPYRYGQRQHPRETMDKTLLKVCFWAGHPIRNWSCHMLNANSSDQNKQTNKKRQNKTKAKNNDKKQTHTQQFRGKHPTGSSGLAQDSRIRELPWTRHQIHDSFKFNKKDWIKRNEWGAVCKTSKVPRVIFKPTIQRIKATYL